MKRNHLLGLAAAALLMLSSCSQTIEYNSNTGYDGSRDSATQLLVNTSRVDDISALDGDNEDWYYFQPTEEGLVTVRANIDRPQELVVELAVYDNFGRKLNSLKTNGSNGVYELPQMSVKPEMYFVSLITSEGKSPYTIRADFELPPPPVIEIIPEEPEPEVAAPTRTKCVPADKCKAGQKCCRPKVAAPAEDGIAAGEKTIVGTVVLVTPSGEIADIKISGVGKNKGVKKGAKAYLRGLNRKVDIYSCLNTSCQATVRASSEELAHYDKVDVVVE